MLQLEANCTFVISKVWGMMTLIILFLPVKAPEDCCNLEDSATELRKAKISLIPKKAIDIVCSVLVSNSFSCEWQKNQIKKDLKKIE